MSAINLIMSAGRRVSQWRRRQQAYAELMALDDHSLADIGLHRSQITGLVGGHHMPDSSAPPVPFSKRATPVRLTEA